MLRIGHFYMYTYITMKEERFSVSKTIKTPYPKIPFKEIKNKILGREYSLSLVLIGSKKSQSLNKKHRQKNKVANILTFSLSKVEGEIFITPKEVKKDIKKFNLNYRSLFALVYIHGLLHLKGRRHSSTMENEEMKWLYKLGFK